MINVYLSYNLLDSIFKVNKTRVLKYQNVCEHLNEEFYFLEKVNSLCSVELEENSKEKSAHSLFC